MKPKRNQWLQVIIVLLCSLITLIAAAETTNDLHLYLDIPFHSATPQTVAAVLSQQRNVTMEMDPDVVLTSYASGLTEWNYLFNLRWDFNEDLHSTYRVNLTSAQASSFSLDECAERIPADLTQYVDMEAQLTAQYGNPDHRYFTTSLMNGKKYIRFMFPEDCWTHDNLQSVCDTHRLLKAYTIWDNVMLEIKVDLTEPYSPGICYSTITLYYYPSVDDLSFVEKYTIEPYEENRYL